MTFLHPLSTIRTKQEVKLELRNNAPTIFQTYSPNADRQARYKQTKRAGSILLPAP
ncbi:hypothetical protein HMPREF0645_0710 [Hallella bergensis DSM 17361]|uniref:Uncharacterized protein n=1 Tax=Hallella bergensis DSM 17361 TaxID=585502 RepID=D1PUS5_9BACT|nr:hypothetical protein HMPREF0645_0710 [Hallella bergensis DSM 17361]